MVKEPWATVCWAEDDPRIHDQRFCCSGRRFTPREMARKRQGPRPRPERGHWRESSYSAKNYGVIRYLMLIREPQLTHRSHGVLFGFGVRAWSAFGDGVVDLSELEPIRRQVSSTVSVSQGSKGEKRAVEKTIDGVLSAHNSARANTVFSSPVLVIATLHSRQYARIGRRIQGYWLCKTGRPRRVACGEAVSLCAGRTGIVCCVMGVAGPGTLSVANENRRHSATALMLI